MTEQERIRYPQFMHKAKEFAENSADMCGLGPKEKRQYVKDFMDGANWSAQQSIKVVYPDNILISQAEQNQPEHG